ncbi:CsdA-binding activator [Salmonella enterica subsp. enterica]|nr:CsdA-binding activator [Salmonella enterica subsp. enterica]
MTNPLYTGHPFGTTVTEETLRAIFLPLTQWEDKYRQLILLGKQLPALPDECKAQAKEIAGCENRVWLGFTRSDNGTMHFFGDSEGADCPRPAGGIAHRGGRKKRRRTTGSFTAGAI